jgi:hypothetical protein
VIDEEGKLYFGSFDQKVYILDSKTGKKLNEFTTGDFICSSPALGRDGKVFVGSGDSHLYALPTMKTMLAETRRNTSNNDDNKTTGVIKGDGFVEIGGVTLGIWKND